MTTRSIRRAMERKARKEELRKLRQAEQSTAEAPSAAPTGRMEANQRNAQLSTGPRSAEGKARVSRNALKTGLTGKTVLLPTDDPELYKQHVARFVGEYQPETEAELDLVIRIADGHWRLNRVPGLESGIYALGRVQFADMFSDCGEAVRPALIEAHIFLTFQKQLNNLSVQEGRLRRNLEKDIAHLNRLQAERKAAEPELDFGTDDLGLNFQDEFPDITDMDALVKEASHCDPALSEFAYAK